MVMKHTDKCRKKNIAIVFLYAALIFITSCQKTDISFGSQFVDNNYTQLIKIDTITTQLSTRFYDSIQTSGTGLGVAGIYTDPVFGTVKASSYFKLIPPTYNSDSDYSRGSYDSLIIIIRPKKNFYGDTTKPVHLDAYRLAAVLQPSLNNTVLYNKDTIAKYPTPLGSADFIYYPTRTDSIKIRLSDDLGKELFKYMQTKDGNIQNLANFQNYFKGLCISPGNNPACMFSYSDSIVMRLYYNNPGVIRAETYKDFTFNDATTQFNHIEINRAGTHLSGVTPDIRSLVSSKLTGNASYLQSATGTSVKVSFPYIRSILQIPNIAKVTQATLVLRPVQGTYGYDYKLPDSLRLSQTDMYNNALGDISISVSGTSYTLYGTLNVDYLYGKNTQYTFDITSYILSQAAISENNLNGLIVSPPQPAFSTRFNRVVFGDGNNSLGNAQLLLYYITVQ
jgi:hypothetical protein